MVSGQMVIDGRFELLEQLGSGGMGTVWRAQDLALHREVALKEVRPAGPAPPDDSSRAQMMRERVLREARALARLDHPNVVTIHHIVDSPGMPHPWIVMELVRGRSLQDRLEQGVLAPMEAAAIGRGILAALRAAHAAGICHRDVKPGNVLLRPDGSPVLTDFGIAALNESTRVTATGGLVGSPSYIAPERLHGEEGNPASDLWSLGMLLYVAVEGHHPMHRATPVATLAAVMKGEVPPPRQAGPLTPILGALLVPDPAARPTGAQLDHMLAQAAGQVSMQFPAPPPMPAQMPPPMPMPVHPTGPNGTSGPTHPSGLHQTAKRPAGATLAAVVGTVVTIGAVLAAVFLLPKVLDSTEGRIAGGPTGPATSGSATEATGPGTGGGAQSGSLLTPNGIRNVITSLEKVTGGTEFTKFTVHEEFASAEAPVHGKPNLYDEFSYRGGEATREGPGGTLDADDARVKLRAFNWAAILKHFSTGKRALGVAKPTTRYLVLDPASVFDNDRPVILVYLSDDYGAGYLAADRNGKVLRTVPRG